MSSEEVYGFVYFDHDYDSDLHFYNVVYVPQEGKLLFKLDDYPAFDADENKLYNGGEPDLQKNNVYIFDGKNMKVLDIEKNRYISGYKREYNYRLEEWKDIPITKTRVILWLTPVKKQTPKLLATSLARQKNLPENIEKKLKSFLGGKRKTRKSKKTRRH